MVTDDQLSWRVLLGNNSTNILVLKDYMDRFPNEGGVLGTSSPASLRQFLPSDEQFLRSFSWDLHDNTKNFTTDKEGVTYKFI